MALSNYLINAAQEGRKGKEVLFGKMDENPLLVFTVMDREATDNSPVISFQAMIAS